MTVGLIQRSFCGAVMILVIVAVRILWLDKLPKRTLTVLWSLVLVRLLVPFSFSSVFSLYTFLQTAQSRSVSDQYAGEMWEGVTFTGNPPAWTMVQELALGQPGAPADKGGGMPILPAIWCAGAVVLMVFFAAAYFRSLRRFREALPVEDGQVLQWLDDCRGGRKGLTRRISVRQSDAILAPLTYGCLRPVILLPRRALEDSGRELKYILQHEFVHIRHCDAVLKLAMVAALCIHWFNPLVWIMCGLTNRDIELACDEGVLRRFGEEARAGYAMTLIGMEEKRVLLPLYNGFSKNAIEERVSLIMKYKKIKNVAVMASLMLVASMALVFATSAETAKAKEDPAQGPDGAWGAEPDGDAGDGLPMDPPLRESQEANGDQDMTAVDLGAPGESEVMEDRSAAEESATGADGGRISYMQEGILQEEPAYLYRGEGFCLLIPEEGWKTDESNGWMYELNERVRFWVTDYRGNTGEQVREILEAEGYARTEQDGILTKEYDGMLLTARLGGSGDGIMTFHYVYPAEPEYEEGFGIVLSAIAANFIVLSEEKPSLSSDRWQLERMALAFWEAYLTGETAELAQYLAADYAGDVETFPDGQDGHAAAEVELVTLKGLDIGETEVGDTVEIWAEFRPGARADYLENLSISAVKEQDGWKVSGYGLEM